MGSSVSHAQNIPAGHQISSNKYNSKKGERERELYKTAKTPKIIIHG